MLKTTKITFSGIILVLALLALTIAFGYALYTYGQMAGAAVAFRYPLDYGEGPLLEQTMRLGAGENLYDNDFSTPPYTISNYPPVFLLFQVPFALVFGAAFWYGRALSILSALLTAAAIGLALHQLTGKKIAAIAGGLVFLSFPYVQYWTVLNRIDSLALALSWIGLFVLVKWNDRRWGIPAVAALLVLSIYTRQSYALAAPFGAFVWLLVKRRWRQAFELALITGGVSLLLFLVINLATQGGFFLNIVTANVNPFSWGTVKSNFGQLTDHAVLLFILVAAFVLGERFNQRTQSWPLAIPYLVGAVLSGMTIGKDGSNVNYLLELAAALAFAAGAAMAWLGRNNWMKVLIAVGLCVQIFILNEWVQDDFINRVMARVRQEDEVETLYNRVKETDGIVLADEFMGLLPLAGKRLYYQPFEYKMLSQGGIWDQQSFLDDLAGHKFALILWYDPSGWDSRGARWTPEERSAIQEYYGWSGIDAETQVLEPR